MTISSDIEGFDQNSGKNDAQLLEKDGRSKSAAENRSSAQRRSELEQRLDALQEAAARQNTSHRTLSEQRAAGGDGPFTGDGHRDPPVRSSPRPANESGISRATPSSAGRTFRRLESEIAECRELIEQHQRADTGIRKTPQRDISFNLESRQKKLDSLKEEQNRFLSAASAAQQRAKLLADMEKHMEGFASSVKFVMNKAAAGALRGVHGPLSQLISTQGEYAVAIETAMGAAMQNIVVENENTAKEAIRLLQSSREGRATFLPLTSVKGRDLQENGLEGCEGFIGVASRLVQADSRYDGVISSVLGRVVIAETLDEAVAMAKKYSYRFRIVTLDGQVVNAGGSMTGGYTAKSTGVLGRRHE